MPRGTNSTARRALTTLADAVLAVVLAPCCAACSRPLDAPSRGPVCDPCWTSVRPHAPPCCRLCGEPLPSWRIVSVAMDLCARCRRGSGALTAGSAAGAHEGPLRSIVHAFKYDGRRSLATGLGALMRSSGREVLAGADFVIPVPLHPWRRLTRGFNQADDLAKHLGLPVVHALWRARATASQAGLTASARRRNVRGAFRLSPFLSASARRALIDGVVVLVDDVRTTGATLNACADVLKSAGVRDVRALTAARAASRERTTPVSA
jgi:ComF family protein